MDWCVGRHAAHGRSLGRVAALPRRLQARDAANDWAESEFWRIFAKRPLRLVPGRSAGRAGVSARALGLGWPGRAANAAGPPTQGLRQGAADARHQVDGGVRRRAARAPRHQRPRVHRFVRKSGVHHCRVDQVDLFEQLTSEFKRLIENCTILKKR